MQLSFRPSSFPASSAAVFSQQLLSIGRHPLVARTVTVLQVNVGYRCNLACIHCHLSAGPGRTEMMSRDTMEAVLGALRRSPVRTLDITGGAPELNPELRYLISEARNAGKAVIVRTNLVALLERDGLPEFYRDRGVELTASLPCYLEQNVEAVRGSGVYQKSIEMLRKLNALGYGTHALPLNLVYNPAGAFLPPEQAGLEADYKRELQSRFGITFTRLYAFTNMPIGRYRRFLEGRAELERYRNLLATSFNQATLDRIMCREIVSVGWDGKLYDCDFNQALQLPVLSESREIARFDHALLSGRAINIDDHCYACTAGQGST